MDDSAIICDEVIESYAKLSLKDNDEETKRKFNEEKSESKAQNFYILLVFLLITIALLIAVSIYCYLIKYRAKQRHLLQFHDTKLKQVYINNIN